MRSPLPRVTCRAGDDSAPCLPCLRRLRRGPTDDAFRPSLPNKHSLAAGLCFDARFNIDHLHSVADGADDDTEVTEGAVRVAIVVPWKWCDSYTGDKTIAALAQAIANGHGRGVAFVFGVDGEEHEIAPQRGPLQDAA